MKALILAAGRGERMRPLTDSTPKPLLVVRGKPLIEWHLESLLRAGVRDIIINTAWLEDQFPAALGDGSRWGLSIRYSMEGRDHGGALETAGGIKKALPLLVDTPSDSFWVVAADVFAPAFAFDVQAAARLAASGRLANLWMVPNPPHVPGGDFGIDSGGLATFGTDGERFTWSAIGLFRAAFVNDLINDLAPGDKARLRPYLDRAIAARRLGAELYDGEWADVGTPQRLAALDTTASP